MNTVRLLPILCLSASLMAQAPAPPSGAVRRSPQIAYAQAFGLLPQIVDGDIWSTVIKVVNLDSQSAEPYEVDFFNEDGSTALVSFVGQSGPVSKLSGSLNPGQTAVFTTPGTTSPTQTTWAILNNNTTGQYISTYELLRNTQPSIHYFAETAVATQIGFYNESIPNSTPTGVVAGGYLPFDNTNGALTALAVVNPDFAGTSGTDTLLIQVINSSGSVIAQHTLPQLKGTHQDFLIQNLWPETRNLAGTLYILPSTGAYSPVSILALSSYATANYKTLSTINILQPTSAPTPP
jgi:hypothetical protein